ncbi:MAG: hypothetical protein ACFFBP_04390 [Promethearchaeota archaeon]
MYITEMSFIFFYIILSHLFMDKRDIFLKKLEHFEKKYNFNINNRMENNELLAAKYKIISKLIRQGYL